MHSRSCSGSGSDLSRSGWRAVLIGLLVALVLLVGQNSPLTFGMGSTPAHAASLAVPSSTKPNRMTPQTGAQSHSRGYTPAPMGNQPPHAPQIIAHPQKMSMQPATVDLVAGQAAQFLGSDGHLEVRIPATALTAADLTQAGGKLRLRITQIAPGSGSNAGGSGHLSFGTYLLQLVDANGTVLTHGLHAPITAIYHFSKKEGVLNLGHAYVVLNGARPQGVASAALAKGIALDSTFGALSSSPVKLDPVQHTMSVSPLLNTPSTSLSWQSDASIGAFGKPDPFSADLNAGALTASYPIDVPAGPGGLTPPVTLAYNSAGVSEQHNPSSAAGWVGEGWTLSMGSINWSEHNVLAGCQATCGTNWENSWQLSDPYGTGSELIPPNINVSTYFDDTPNFYCGTGNAQAFPCPILWHTANESYAKIYAYVGPFAIAGSGPATNSPCFRVWLKNGIMEEFGCTQDSVQYYYEPGNGQGALLSAWNLDMITDPQGNQIHLTYQQDLESWTNPVTHATFNYPRDEVLSTIEYDSPTCHNAQTRCTGANWDN